MSGKLDSGIMGKQEGGHLSSKVLGATGMLPVQVHRLKTCATNTFYALWGGRKAHEELSRKFRLGKTVPEMNPRN